MFLFYPIHLLRFWVKSQPRRFHKNGPYKRKGVIRVFLQQHEILRFLLAKLKFPGLKNNHCNIEDIFSAGICPNKSSDGYILKDLYENVSIYCSKYKPLACLTFKLTIKKMTYLFSLV